MSVARKAKRSKKVVDLHNDKPSIQLDKDSIRWFENLVLKEQVIRKDAEAALQAVAKEAEEMMNSFTTTYGADLRGYDIDWKTGVCTPKKPSKEESKK